MGSAALVSDLLLTRKNDNGIRLATWGFTPYGGKAGILEAQPYSREQGGR
jgi:hypothetical protein